MTAPLTEAQLQAAIIDLCRWTGWLVMHPYDSRRTVPGYPDLTMVNRESGRTMFAELKAENGRLTDAQREWITFLSKRNEAYVWRPSDWSAGIITAALTGRQQASA
jgi:hypothetical protein